MIADQTTVAFDTLTDLFLGPDGPEHAPKPEADSPESLSPAFEMVVLGNLPGVASAWPGQYARTLHEQLGVSVAVIQKSKESLSVQLVGPSGVFVPADLPAAAAVATALAHARRVLVVLTCSEDEPVVLADSRVQAATLLSGADDASCVNAYKVIKRLANLNEAIRDGEQPRAAIRFACMGASVEKAHAAWERLRDSAGSFLDIELEASGVIERLDAGQPATVLFEGDSSESIADLLAAADRVVPVTLTPASPRFKLPRHEADRSAIHLTNGHATHGHVHAHGHSHPPLQPHPHAHPHTHEHPVKPTLHHARADLHDQFTRMPAARASDEARPEPVQSETAPSRHVASTHEASNARPVLSSGPMLAGLSALPFHCPNDPEVMLSVDAAGVPQVVGRAIGTDPRAMIYRLVATAAWMWANRPLLAQVSAGSMRDDARPQLHLVTDDIASVRTLLDSEIRVHAAIDVTRATQGIVLLALN